MIRTWYRHKPEGWILTSGLWSPLYIQLRILCSYPSVLKEIGEAMSILLQKTVPDATRIVGIAMAGIPIAVATSLTSGLPSTFTRKSDVGNLCRNGKQYGEHSILEGELLDNDTIVLMDDVVTKLDTKLHAIAQVEQEIEERGLKNVRCNHVAVVIDREQGATLAAKTAKIYLHSLIKFRTKALGFLSSRMAPIESQVISDYLLDPLKYQDMRVRKELTKQTQAGEHVP
jgi:uridine monophosphate synthetase